MGLFMCVGVHADMYVTEKNLIKYYHLKKKGKKGAKYTLFSQQSKQNNNFFLSKKMSYIYFL